MVKAASRQPDQLSWCNESTEQYLSYGNDIEYHPIEQVSFRFEVKTNWGKNKVKASDAQVDQVLTNKNYMLLQVQQLRNLFLPIPIIPHIRLITQNLKKKTKWILLLSKLGVVGKLLFDYDDFPPLSLNPLLPKKSLFRRVRKDFRSEKPKSKI